MKCKLKDLGIISTGNTPSKSNEAFYISKDIAFVKPDTLSDCKVTEMIVTTEYISENARNKARIVGKGAVFVTCIGSIGKIGLAGREFAFNQQINAIQPNGRVLSKYLAYSMLYNKKALQAIANAPVVPIINKSQFEDFEIEIEEDLNEQTKIVEILDKVNDVITSREKELEELDNLIKSRFVEMFGDPVTNPYGWEKQRFDSLCENLDARRKPITASEREEGIYPYYGASGVVDHVADYLFDEDILLVSEDGANLLMRSTPIAFSVSGKVWVNNHAHVVRFEKMSMQKYIEVYFSMIDISEQITGSAQPKLNQAKLNAMMFAVPDETRLEEFLLFIHQVTKLKFEVQKSLDETQVLFDSLMQKYFG